MEKLITNQSHWSHAAKGLVAYIVYGNMAVHIDLSKSPKENRKRITAANLYPLS